MEPYNVAGPPAVSRRANVIVLASGKMLARAMASRSERWPALMSPSISSTGSSTTKVALGAGVLTITRELPVVVAMVSHRAGIVALPVVGIDQPGQPAVSVAEGGRPGVLVIGVLGAGSPEHPCRPRAVLAAGAVGEQRVAQRQADGEVGRMGFGERSRKRGGRDRGDPNCFHAGQPVIDLEQPCRPPARSAWPPV